jgi:hypothetical protein
MKELATERRASHSHINLDHLYSNNRYGCFASRLKAPSPTNLGQLQVLTTLTHLMYVQYFAPVNTLHIKKEKHEHRPISLKRVSFLPIDAPKMRRNSFVRVASRIEHAASWHATLIDLVFFCSTSVHMKEKLERRNSAVKPRRAKMGLGVIMLVCIVVLAITALIALLTKDHKDNFHQAARRLFLPPPLMGTTNPRKSGFWYTTNGFAGEKVKEAILQGQDRYANKRRSHPAHTQQKRPRHGR